MKDIELKNQEIENTIKDLAKNLLKDRKVDMIIGYTKGTVPLSSSPIFITREEDIDKLIWNNLCYANLAKYLAPRGPMLYNKEGQEIKVGIVAKGCVGRAIIHLT
jgi:formate dehydrogenase subunit beta